MCKCDEDVSVDSGPRVMLRHSSSAGDCNGCNRHIDEYGMNGHQVFEIHLNSLVVRLCRECARIVKRGMPT